MKNVFKYAIKNFIFLLSDSQVLDLVMLLVSQQSNRKDSASGLRFLFQVDSAMYALEGSKASEYGGGAHPKHRLTHYHDFFIQRISKNERVLDIGCGPGMLAYDIADKSGALVTGIDLNAAYLKTARSQYAHPNITYIHGNVLTDLPNNQVDVAVLSNVLEHLPGRSQFLNKLVETVGIKRFLIRVPLFERDWRVPLKKELGLDWRLDTTHETEYTLESFCQEMEEAHLKISHQEVRWGEIWAEVVVDDSKS